MKILIIGGTGFLGRHLTATALAQNHEVILFNRGNQNLFKEKVQTLIGDRAKAEDLEKLADVEFDTVIDTCGYFPSHVESMAKVLRNCAHYIFISTVSVYDLEAIETSTIDESSKVVIRDYESEPTKITGENYGALKYQCEERLAEHFKGVLTVIRPGFIVGPDDHTYRLPYWLGRMAEGGDVFLPTELSAPTQFIDVRALSEFALELAKDKRAGFFNAVGPDDELNMGELLNEIAKVVGSEVKAKVKVKNVEEEKFFAHEGFNPALVPFLFYKGGYKCARVKLERAKEAGLRNWPLSQTLEDTWQWMKGEGREFPYGFLGREEEKRFLKDLAGEC